MRIIRRLEQSGPLRPRVSWNMRSIAGPRSKLGASSHARLAPSHHLNSKGREPHLNVSYLASFLLLPT